MAISNRNSEGEKQDTIRRKHRPSSTEMLMRPLNRRFNLRYQDFGDKLHVDNIKLEEELEQQKLNLRDINEFLTNELKARSLTTSAMEGKVMELYHQIDELQRRHEETMGKLRKDAERQIEALEGHIKDYERKARTAQEFLERKDYLEGELTQARETLEKKVKDYEQLLTDMDRQHIQDREKWKRETAQKIKETKIQMMKLTDNQLEMTTKRTIMENEQMSIELAYQSRQTEKLLHKNQTVMEENSDLRRQLELSRQTEEELAKRNNVYQKTIKSLLTKLKEQGAAQEENGDLVSSLEERISDLEGQLHLSSLQQEELQHQLTLEKSRLKERQALLNAWTSKSDQAVSFLMTCLEDVKDKIVSVEGPGGGGEGDEWDNGPHFKFGVSETVMNDLPSVVPGRLDDLNAEQRERVLSHLLERLNIFTRSQQLEAASQVLSASAHTSPPGSRHASHHRSASAGLSNTGGVVSLPSIPAYNRRRAATTLDMPSPPEVGSSSRLRSVTGGGSKLSQSGPLRSSLASDRARVEENDEKQEEETGGEIPAVADLLEKVMMDPLRPWGKKSTELQLTPKVGKGGVFLQKKTGNAGSPGFKR